jgi:LemA protein
MVPLIIAAVLIILPLLWAVLMFNELVRTRNACRESWADVDTELKRRYDLIPRLVEVVKGYAAHERALFEAVAAARSRAQSSTGSPVSQARDEDALVGELRRLLILVEGYPVLKADRHFLELQRELVNTEDRIQAARRFYNANVRDLNNRVETFPSNLVAGMAGFTTGEYFEIRDVLERVAPMVRI